MFQHKKKQRTLHSDFSFIVVEIKSHTAVGLLKKKKTISWDYQSKKNCLDRRFWKTTYKLNTEILHSDFGQNLDTTYFSPQCYVQHLLSPSG